MNKDRLNNYVDETAHPQHDVPSISRLADDLPNLLMSGGDVLRNFFKVRIQPLLTKTITSTNNAEEPCHFTMGKKDNSLLFFNYDRTNHAPTLFGYVFFFHFFMVWMVSFLGWPYFAFCLFRGSLGFPAIYLLLAAFTYSNIPRHYIPFKKYIFLEIPKYFWSSSYRVLKPHDWPELEPVMTLMNNSNNINRESPSVPRPLPNAQDVVYLVRKTKVPARIWMFHPHGLLATGWGLQSFNPYFATVKHCVSTFLYSQPPIICYSSLCGSPESVRAASVKKILGRGDSISIIPGGFEEATLHPNEGDRLVLRVRKGIFKYALQFGAELVPVFTFGESKAFKNLQGCWNFRLWLNSFAIPGQLPFGRLPFPWMPRNEMCHVVVGTPIQVQRNLSPSVKEIDQLQVQYIKELRTIYDSYKKEFYGAEFDMDLQFWD